MSTTESKITERDLEAKLRSFQDGVQSKVDDQKNTLVAVAGGVGVVLLIVFFLLGKRAGRKKTTLVEIRRI